jgi:hypothetical protein
MGRFAGALAVLATVLLLSCCQGLAKVDQGDTVFGEASGVLLLFDDGLEGLTAVDLDRRIAARSAVEGQRPGDEPYSMIQAGDHLVVGWHEPHAVDIRTRQARSLGEATIFLPAAEPNRVWMLDYGDRIGPVPPNVWQVDVGTGEAVTETVELTVEGDPQIGIPGGLALQSERGMALWDLAGGFKVLESDGPGWAHHVRGDQLVWCSDHCLVLQSTSTSAVETSGVEVPDTYDSFVGQARISPDGRFLSALLGRDDPTVGEALLIKDRHTGDEIIVSDPETEVAELAWSSGSDQLFATSRSYGESETVVWRYDVIDDTFEAVVLPFGEGLGVVVIDAGASDAYIPVEQGEMDACFPGETCSVSF